MKAQTQQMFIYIGAIIICGLLLLMGVRYMGEFTKMIDNWEKVRFRKQIESRLDIDYNDERAVDIRIPDSYGVVCLLDRKFDAGSSLCTEYPLICNTWHDNTSNIAGEPPIAMVPELPALSIDGGYMCFEGRIRMTAVGAGDYLKLSRD